MPARGMERWLAHRLAHRLGTASGRGDGVCAHVAFPAPGEVVAAALEGARAWPPTTTRGIPPGRCGRSWRSSTPARAGRGAPPGRAPGAGAQQVRGGRAPRRAVRRLRHPPARAARRLARGRRRGRARGPALAAGAVAGACGRGSASRTRAERLATAVAALERDPACCALPERLSLFGPTRLPADHLAVLAALGRAPRRPPLAAAPLPRAVGPRRAADRGPCPRAAPTPPPTLPRHPLLASLGRDVRELQLRAGGPSPASTRTTPGAGRRTGDAAAAPATRPPRRPRARPATTSLAADDRRSRCTPATARTARSRCSARSCSACSPTTRRWSRATSSSMCPDVETFAPLVVGGLRARAEAARATATPATGSRSGSPTGRCGR